MLRSKILLAGALAGTKGPAVSTDEGVWEIPSHPFVNVLFPAHARVQVLPDKIIVKGKVRISTMVNPKYKGKPIHLDMIQVEA